MPKHDHDLKQARTWALIARDHVADLVEALHGTGEPEEDDVLFLVDQAQSAVGKTRSFAQKHYEAKEAADG